MSRIFNRAIVPTDSCKPYTSHYRHLSSANHLALGAAYGGTDGDRQANTPNQEPPPQIVPPTMFRCNLAWRKRKLRPVVTDVVDEQPAPSGIARPNRSAIFVRRQPPLGLFRHSGFSRYARGRVNWHLRAIAQGCQHFARSLPGVGKNG